MKLSDPYNTSEFKSRTGIIIALFGLLFSILVARLFYLQVVRGEVYRRFSDQNRFRVETLSAPRGKILDRNGRLLADSRPRFDLSVIRGNAIDLGAELRILAKALEWSEAELEQRLTRIKNSPRYSEVLVARDLKPEVLAYIESRNLDLPSIVVQVTAVRDYLYKDAFFHVIGYTGEISEGRLKQLQRDFPQRKYRLGDQRGVIGVEALYEGELRGQDGSDFVVVDVRGRRVNEKELDVVSDVKPELPIAGKTVTLTLDLDLQMVAHQAFGEQEGAVVAMNPQTGEILAYVSHPAIDPNLFSGVVDRETFESLTAKKSNPFLDRAVGEHYPPGSTLKLVMAAAAVEAGVIDDKTTFFCPGHFQFGRRVWRCHERKGHGRVDLKAAIAESCDVFFYQTALLLGLDSMYTWSTRFGFGRRTFVGSERFESSQDRIYRFNSEQPGFIPYPEWVRSKGHTTIEAESINAGIGQGAFLTTVLQLARMVSMLGNGGKIFQPQLVKSVSSVEGEQVRTMSARVENRLVLDPVAEGWVIKGMEEVIHGERGTARGSRLPGLIYGGKTGTSQVVALEFNRDKIPGGKFQDHALFVALAPLENPTLAIAVIVENGGSGSKAAAPIAKAMINAYLKPQASLEKKGSRTNGTN